ncbi:MAG: hypothetical protein NVS3B24_03940 [Candidatus Dormibacteria bacterium]
MRACAQWERSYEATPPDDGGVWEDTQVEKPRPFGRAHRSCVTLRHHGYSNTHVVLFFEDCSDETEQGRTIRKDADHGATPADLTVEAL